MAIASRNLPVRYCQLCKAGLVIIATTIASVPVRCSEQATNDSRFDYGTTVSDQHASKCPIVRQGALHIKRYGQLDGRTGPAGPWYPPGDSAHTADARDALGPQARCTLLETSRTCSTRILPIGGGRTVKVAHTKGPSAIVWTISGASRNTSGAAAELLGAMKSMA